MKPLIEAALAAVRETLSLDAFADAFATGLQMSFDEAFATSLAPVRT
ncbi:MAG: hypothetical protein HC802_14320 [Caldilineaceae bacterium]|nr:hypothetical protein [Caldilineaceae bacterium]